MKKLAMNPGVAGSLDKRRILLYALILLLIVGPFIASLVSIPDERNREAAEARTLPELYVMAVEGLNMTVSSIKMIEHPPEEAYEYSLQAYEGLREFRPIDTPGLLGNISKTVEAYRTIALAGLQVYNASPVIVDAVAGGKQVIDLLRQCRIQEAIAEWRSVEQQVDDAIAESQGLLDVLTSVDPGYLLSDEHKRVIRESVALFTVIAQDLERLKQIMGIVQANSDSIEKLCNGNPTREGIMAASNIAQQAKGSQSPSPMKIDMLKLASFYSILSSGGQQGGGSSSMPGLGDSGPGGGGKGAGYGVPPSDD